MGLQPDTVVTACVHGASTYTFDTTHSSRQHVFRYGHGYRSKCMEAQLQKSCSIQRLCETLLNIHGPVTQRYVPTVQLKSLHCDLS